MSQVVDKRVVEMSFDNSNFEKNVSTSMSTLDKLKKALKLDGVSKGLDQVNKSAQAIDLSSIATGVEALQRRFSVVGEVGHNALMKITNSVTKLSTSLFSFVANGIKSGGIKRAMNLEQANFMMQGLLKDNAAVAAIMQDVNKSVDGTAYSLDAAAKVAAQFAATGMRGGEQMYSALRGVAGVAAMTNSEYEQIGMIFSQVAGKGRVMGDELLQLASRGINAAAVLKDYMNKTGMTVNATEGEIRDMVSKGKIDFALFAAAMDDAFGEHATKANETFTGAMSNIRSALARIGADFVAPLIKQNGALVGLFNSIRVKVNEVRKQTTPFAEETTKALISIIEKVDQLVASFKVPDLTDGFQVIKNLAMSIRNIFVNLSTVIDPIKLAFKDVFPEGLPNLILMLSDALVKLTGSAKLNLDQMVGLRGAFTVIFTVLKWGGTIISTVVNAAFEHLGSVISSLIGYVSKFTSYISKNMSAFVQWADSVNLFTKGVELFKSGFNTVITAVKNWFKAFKELPQVKIAIEAVMDLFERLRNRSGGIFKKMGQIISDFVKNAIEDLKNFKLSDIANLFKDLFNVIKEAFGPTVLDWFNNFKNAFGSVRDFIVDAGGNVGKAFLKIYDAVKWVITNVVDALKSIPLGSFLATGFGAAVLLLANKIIDIVAFLAHPLKSLDALMGNVNGVLTAAQKVEKAIASRINAESMFVIAKAIATLAGSVIALAFVPSDRLWEVVGALGALAGGLIALGGAFTLINRFGGGGVDGVGLQLIGLAIAVKLMISALKDVGDMQADDVLAGMVATFALLAELVGAAILLSKFTKSSDVWESAGMAAVIISIAAAMKLIVSAFNDLQKADPEGAKQAIVSMMELMGMLALLTRSGKNANWQSAVTFLGASFAIKLMVSTVKDINKISKADMANGIAIIGQFEFLLGALTLINSLADRLGGKYSHDAGGTFMAFAGAIGILTLCIKLINSISPADLDRGIKTIGKFELLFAGVALISRLAGQNGGSAALSMIGFSGAMLIISASIGILSAIPKENLDNAVEAIEVIGVIMAGIVGMTHFATDAKGTMIGIAAALAVLAISMGALSFVDPEKLQNVSLCLSLVIAAFSLVVKGSRGIKKGMGVIITLTVAIGLLAGCLTAMSILGVENALPNAAGLSILLVSLAATLRIIAGLDEVSGEAIGSLYLLTGVVALLGGALLGMNDLKTDGLLEKVVAVSAIMLAMSGIVYLFDKGQFDVSTLKYVGIGATALVELMAILGAAAVAIGAACNKWEWIETDMNKGLEIMKNLGTGLGEALGAFVSGFIDEASSGLIDLADNLNSFGEKIQTFFGYMEAMPDSVPGKVSALAGMLIELGAAQIVTAISNAISWLSGGDTLVTMCDNLVDFVAAFQKVCFALIITPINQTAIDALVKIGDMFATLQAVMPREGGKLQEYLGHKKDLESFGEEAAAFIAAMKEANDSLKDVTINDAAIESITKAGNLFAALQEALPRTGGKWQEFTGEKLGLDTFGQNVKDFCAAMSGVSMYLTLMPINEGAVQSLYNAGDMMSQIQNSLPSINGAIQYFTGTTMDLETFGINIKMFANNLSIASNYLTTNPIDEDAIQSAVNMGDLLSGLQNSLPSVNGKLQDWFGGGTMTLSDFGSNIRLFANDMQYVSTYAKNVKSGAITNMVSATRQVAKIFEVLPDNAGGWGTGKLSISAFGTYLVTFGGHMKQFSSDISGFNFINLITMASSLQSLVDVFSNVEALNTGTIDSFTSALEDLAKNGIKSFTDEFENASADVQAAISSFVTTVVNSIQADPMALATVFEPWIDNAVLTLTSAQDVFRQAAVQIMTAFSTGISAGIIVATTAGMTLCQGILHTFDAHANALGPNAGMSLVKAVSQGMLNTQSLANRAIQTILTTLLTTIASKQPNFVTSGRNIVTSMSQGITSMAAKIKMTLDLLLNSLVLAIASKGPQFKTAGSALITQLSAGVTANSGAALSAMNNVLTVMSSAFIAGYSKMYSSGGYLVQGLAQGVYDNAWRARSAANSLANELSATINNALKIHSPSQVAYESGDYYDQGLAKGVADNSDKVTSAGDQIAKALMRAIDVAIPPIEEGMKEFGARIVTRIAEGMESNKEAFTKIIKDVVDKAVPNAIESLGNLGTDIVAKIKDSIAESDEISKALESQVTSLTETFQESLTTFGKDIMGKITEGMQSAKEKIPEILGEILNEITPKLLKNIGEASTQMITEKIMEGLGTFEGFNDQMKESLVGFFPSVEESYIELGTKMMDKINEGMQKAEQVMPEVLTKIVNEMTPQILKNIGSQSTELITEKIIEGIGSFEGFNEDAKKYLTGFFPEVNESFHEFGKQIMEKVNEGMKEVNDVIPEVLDEIATKAIPTILSKIGEVSTDVITQKILEGFGEFEGFDEKTVERLSACFPDILEKYKILGEDMIKQINVGMSETENQISEVLDDIVTKMTPQLLKSLGTASTQLITAKIIEGIKSFSGFTEAMKEQFTGFMPDIENDLFEMGKLYIQKINDGIASSDASVGGRVVESIKESKTDILAEIETLTGEIVDTLTKAMSSFGEFGPILVETLTKSSEDVTTAMRQLGSDMVDWIAQGTELNATEFLKAYLNLIGSVKQPIIDDTESLGAKVASKLNESIAKNATKTRDILVQSISDALDGLVGKFQELGQDFVEGLMTAPADMLHESLVEMVERLVDDYFVYGGDIVNSFANGMMNNARAPEKRMSYVLDQCINAIKRYRASFQSSGTYIMDGVAAGIRAATSRIVAAAIAAAEAANAAFNQTLQINSPSRVGMKSGMFYAMGIAKGVLGGVGYMVDASKRFATTVKDTLNAEITDVIDSLGESDEFEPTITPVLDLTKVRAEANQLDAILSRDKAVSISDAIELARIRRDSENQNGKENTEKPQYNFVQNNYSPKALSRLEIYRDTQHLVRTASRKKVGAT